MPDCINSMVMAWKGLLCFPRRRRLGIKRLVVSMFSIMMFVAYQIPYTQLTGSIVKKKELFKKEIDEYFARYYTKIEYDDSSEWQIEQRGRKAALDDYCTATNRNNSIDWGKWLLKYPYGLNHFLVSDKHKLIFCSVPKVSSTNWKNVFLILNGNANMQTIKELSLGNTHGNTVTLGKHNLTLDEFKIRLETYTSFMFVRHPFVRALSAYLDKFQSERSTDYLYLRNVYGPKMNAYGNRSLEEGDPDFASATFIEYARYLGDRRTRLALDEDHWAPMSDLCFPCQKHYDFIGKLETYETDTRHILDNIGMSELNNVALRRPPQSTNSSNSAQIQHFFSTLSDLEIADLKRRYKDDFNLFGYDDLSLSGSS